MFRTVSKLTLIIKASLESISWAPRPTSRERHDRSISIAPSGLNMHRDVYRCDADPGMGGRLFGDAAVAVSRIELMVENMGF